MSYTKVSPEVLQICVDNFETEKYNDLINRHISLALKLSERKPKWNIFEPFKKPRQLTFDEALEIVTYENGINWFSWLHSQSMSRVATFRQLMKSGSDIFISSDDAWILNYK